MKKYPCIEATLDIDCDDFTVRLWLDRDSTEETRETWLEERRIAERILGFVQREEPRLEVLLDWLAELPRLNAAQVVSKPGPDRVRHGTVIYTVPFQDVRG